MRGSPFLIFPLILPKVGWDCYRSQIRHSYVILLVDRYKTCRTCPSMTAGRLLPYRMIKYYNPLLIGI